MICVPIKKRTVKALLGAFFKAQKEADVIEFWFDSLDEKEKGKALSAGLEKIFSNKKCPLMYKFAGDMEIFEKVLAHNPEFVDLDLKTQKSVIAKVKKISPRTKVLLSHHDFSETPGAKRLQEIAEEMVKKGADIMKIATTANEFSDSLRMLEFLADVTAKGQKAVCLCMGGEGKITRIAGHLVGNYLMYCPIKSADKTADGQVTVAELRKFQNLI